jgi:hypothetical protein
MNQKEELSMEHDSLGFQKPRLNPLNDADELAALVDAIKADLIRLYKEVYNEDE